jgi:hypothetical protein
MALRDRIDKLTRLIDEVLASLPPVPQLVPLPAEQQKTPAEPGADAARRQAA